MWSRVLRRAVSSVPSSEKPEGRLKSSTTHETFNPRSFSACCAAGVSSVDGAVSTKWYAVILMRLRVSSTGDGSSQMHADGNRFILDLHSLISRKVESAFH